MVLHILQPFHRNARITCSLLPCKAGDQGSGYSSHKVYTKDVKFGADSQALMLQGLYLLANTAAFTMGQSEHY